MPSQGRVVRRAGHSCPPQMPVPSSEAALIKHLLHASSLPCVGDTGHAASSTFGIPNTGVCTQTYNDSEKELGSTDFNSHPAHRGAVGG